MIIELYKNCSLQTYLDYEPIFDSELKCYWAEFKYTGKVDDIRVCTEDRVVGRKVSRRMIDLKGINKIVIPEFKKQGGFI